MVLLVCLSNRNPLRKYKTYGFYVFCRTLKLPDDAQNSDNTIFRSNAISL